MLKKTTKRFISIVMAVMMITSTIPFTAFAADETTASDNAETTNAIGGTIEKVADTDTWYSDATREFMTRETFWNDQVSGQPDTYTVNQDSKIVSIGSAEALVWWAKQVNSGTSFAGYTINITNDIDLSTHYWTPICTGTVSYTADGKYSIADNATLDGTTINGNGHTITGLATQTGVRGPNQGSKPGDGQNCYYDAAFIGYSCCDITINNLTFNGARIAISDPDAVTQTNGSSMLAVIVGAQVTNKNKETGEIIGGSLTLNNVTVNNADVLAMQKAAAFVGNLMGNSTLTVNNCAITNSRFSAYFMVAPISSYSTAEQVTINGIKLENNHVRMVDQSWPNGYYQDPNNGAWYIDEDGNSVDINACTTAMFRDGTNTAITNGTLSGTGTAWTPVASVDGYMYASLGAALNAAKDGDTVELLTDLTNSADSATKNVALNNDIILEGNHHSISGNIAIYVNAANANTTIQNINFTNIHNADSKLSAVYASGLSGKLTIEGCTFKNCDWDAIQTTPVTNSEVIIKGNTFEHTTDASGTQQRFIHIESASNTDFSATVTGNKLIGNIVQEAMGVYFPANPSKVVLSGNYINTKFPVCILNGQGSNIAEMAYPMANEDMTTDNSIVAIVKDQYYATAFSSFTDALNAADSTTNTVTLIQNVSINNELTITDANKIEFNNKKLILLANGKINASIDLGNNIQPENGYTLNTSGDSETGFTYTVSKKPSSGGGSTVIPTPDPEDPSDSEETVTNPDGSTTTTITKEDGSSSTTTVGTDGKVESEVTVSKDAVDNADGSAVTLPMPEVPVTTDKTTAPTVTVNLPSKDATKVEVPVKDVTAGTVAVLVDADGNETVIKDTVQSENGITFEVTDGTTIKVVDNSKSFNDVTDNYWGAGAIDFATSRELFAGTAENTFSPEGDMTRAMIWSVLARYEGADTPGGTGDTWYAGPQKWAMENGISDGTMANSAMTREQFAAMLYRYVGSPAVSGSVGNYSDADSISSWAQDAMVWAVQQGLIAGMDDGTLNPQGTATRTQVAAIFQRFIENKMA